MLYSVERKEDEGMFGRKSSWPALGNIPACINICGKTSQNQLRGHTSREWKSVPSACEAYILTIQLTSSISKIILNLLIYLQFILLCCQWLRMYDVELGSIGCWWIINWKESGWKCSWHNLSHYSDICLERLKRSTKSVSQNSRCDGINWNTNEKWWCLSVVAGNTACSWTWFVLATS
jgi:hypothetical protein